MHLHRDAAAVVLDSAGTVLLKNYPDGIAVSRKMLVHRVVHDLIDQVIQALCPDAADVHSGPFPYCLKSFQYCDAVRVILCSGHESPP